MHQTLDGKTHKKQISLAIHIMRCLPAELHLFVLTLKIAWTHT